MSTKHQKRLGNRATAGCAYSNPSSGQCCDDELLFAMKDNHHEFTMGITTILNCLQVAEAENAVPALPNEWWNAVMCRYRLTQMTFQATGNNEPSTS